MTNLLSLLRRGEIKTEITMIGTELNVKAMKGITIEPENMFYTNLTFRLHDDDFAAMIDSLDAAHQRAALDVIDKEVIRGWLKERKGNGK